MLPATGLLSESVTLMTMVPGCTDSLNVAVIVELTGTLVAPLVGVCAVIVGATVSAVVKDQVTGDIVLPEASCAPLTVAV